jgi:hypothetical protein
MTINYNKLINWDIPEVTQRLTKRDGNIVSFRSTVPARAVTVLNNGRAVIR